MTVFQVFVHAPLRDARLAASAAGGIASRPRRRCVAILALAAPLLASVDFSRDIEPVLRRNCQACHGAAVQSGGLRLDTREGALAGGRSGPAIVPGRAESSRLYRVIAGLDAELRMPPAGARLGEAEVKAIGEWIGEGAPWSASRARHWAFEAPKRPPVPRVRDSEWTRSPIDAFVLARLEALGVPPSAEADPVTLVRRLHFDLTGLPPRPETIEHYLSSSSRDRYERLVDDLLASPRFGEKWARHWLDLCRFSDSEGNESDFPRPYAWRYRHWLIEAFNAGMPFDRCTVEQIAGDLLPDPTPEQRAALGFHRNTSSNREGGADIPAERVEQVADRTNAAGMTWLGLTVGCARCHDHKYDPISRRDYYGLFAFFNNADEVNVDAPLPRERERWLPRRAEYERKRHELIAPIESGAAALQVKWEERIRSAGERPGEDHVWDRQLELLGLQWEQGHGGGQLEGLTVLHTPLEKRTARQRDHMLEMFLGRGAVTDPARFKELDLAAVSKKLQALLKDYPPLTQAPSMTERSILRRDNYIHLRGDFRSVGEPVTEDVPAELPRLPSGMKRDRLALARWLVAAENPLTARVTANRVWQEMFGRGLVATPDNFGLQGDRPSHPELLDWLAVEFRESGWGFKRLLRAIVLSATYRQASHRRKDLDERDPNNTLLARQARFRIPGESVRDAALLAGGLLAHAIGGPSVRPPQPASVSREGFLTEWEESKGANRYRRGLYTHMQRTAPFAQSMTFDAPDPNLMCARRERSNSPLQALTLLNDPVFHEAASALAGRVSRESGPSDRARIERAFQLCFGRKPSQSEMDRAASFVERESRRGPAAWTMLASGLMNADEFYTRE